MSYQYVPLEGGIPKKGTWVNHRATVRYQCPPATPGRVILVNDQEFQRGWVQDLSATGIGMHLNRPLAVGTLVVIQMKSAGAKKTCELAARVVHATQRPTGEWLVGCELVTKLSDDDLEALL